MLEMTPLWLVIREYDCLDPYRRNRNRLIGYVSHILYDNDQLTDSFVMHVAVCGNYLHHFVNSSLTQPKLCVSKNATVTFPRRRKKQWTSATWIHWLVWWMLESNGTTVRATLVMKTRNKSVHRYIDARSNFTYFLFVNSKIIKLIRMQPIDVVDFWHSMENQLHTVASTDSYPATLYYLHIFFSRQIVFTLRVEIENNINK